MLKTALPLKKKSLLVFAAATIIISSFSISSCKTTGDDPTPNPVISSISPATAFPGENITITGSYFAGEASQNTVYFGTTVAAIVSETTTQIVVTVPSIAKGDYEVKVVANALASGTKSFTVSQILANISSFAPTSGKFDDEITITGENFGTNTSNVKVSINGKEQEIVSLSDTQVKIKLAKKTFSGEVKLELTDINGTQEAIAANEFTYTESYRVEELFDLRATKVITDTEGNIYGIQLTQMPGQYNVVKINKGATTIDTIVKYNADTKCYNIITDANNNLYVYGLESSKIYKYKAKDDLELYCDLPNTASATPARLCYDANGILYVAKTVEKDIYKVENGTANLLANSSDYINEITYNPKGVISFVTNSNVNELSLSGTISTYANLDNTQSTSIITDRMGKLLIIDNSGKLLKENDDKTFTEWLPTLLGGYTLYSMCYTPEGDLLLAAQIADSKLIKLVIE